MRHTRTTEEVEHFFADFIFEHDSTIEVVDINIYSDQPKIYIHVLPYGIVRQWPDEQIEHLAQAFCSLLLPEGFSVVFAWPSDKATHNGDFKTAVFTKPLTERAVMQVVGP